jgi:hypothetical protein
MKKNERNSRQLDAEELHKEYCVWFGNAVTGGVISDSITILGQGLVILRFTHNTLR